MTSRDSGSKGSVPLTLTAHWTSAPLRPGCFPEKALWAAGRGLGLFAQVRVEGRPSPLQEIMGRFSELRLNNLLLQVRA